MRARRVTGWVLFGSALAGCFIWPRAAAPDASFTARLLGPIGSLAASWQWVRVRSSWTDGRTDRACAQAELAFELDPGATGGWTFFASHLASYSGTSDHEPDPTSQILWVEAALTVLERGRLTARQPAQLALMRGTILVSIGDDGRARSRDGGVVGAWQEAQAAFERATHLDPGLSEAWAQAAANRLFRLGDPIAEPEAEERRRALDEALAILTTGEGSARQPESLQFQRGYLLALFARSPDGPTHPLGRRGLFDAAIEAFARAKSAGHLLAQAEETRVRGERRALDEL
jgi:hypothetical protein